MKDQKVYILELNLPELNYSGDMTPSDIISDVFNKIVENDNGIDICNKIMGREKFSSFELTNELKSRLRLKRSIKGEISKELRLKYIENYGEDIFKLDNKFEGPLQFRKGFGYGELEYEPALPMRIAEINEKIKNGDFIDFYYD